MAAVLDLRFAKDWPSNWEEKFCSNQALNKAPHFVSKLDPMKDCNKVVLFLAKMLIFSVKCFFTHSCKAKPFYAMLASIFLHWEWRIQLLIGRLLTQLESIFSSPAIAEDGTVYIGSNDNKLHAINSDGSTNGLSPQMTGLIPLLP